MGGAVYVLFCGAKSALVGAIVLVIAMFEGEDPVGRVEALDLQSGGFLSRAIEAGHFMAREGEIFSSVVPAPLESSPELKNIFFVGLGKRECFSMSKAREIGGKIFDAINKAKFVEAAVLIEGDNRYSMVAEIAYGALDKSYVFNTYRTINKKDYERSLAELRFLVDNEDYASSYLPAIKARYEGLKVARDFITSPPNVLHPEYYPEAIKEVFAGSEKVKIEILDAKSMSKLGMGALLAVGRASSREPRMVIIKYNGAVNKDEQPVALVGKGVTFDSGGISLKPSKGMWDMKSDMSGSAVVVGAIRALSLRSAKINVVGVLPIVENAIGGNAQRPSDVVQSMSKKNIEVLNTDAEGRLILADAIHYVQEVMKPRMVIDIATLTGAIVVALGNHYAGCFSNDQNLASELLRAGEMSGDLLWQMPIAPAYDKLIDSDIADVKNIATAGFGADSITAAQFLKRFVADDMPWAHLDIAGVSWDKTKGATGFGVSLFDHFFANLESEKKSVSSE